MVVQDVVVKNPTMRSRARLRSPTPCAHFPRSCTLFQVPSRKVHTRPRNSRIAFFPQIIEFWTIKTPRFARIIGLSHVRDHEICAVRSDVRWERSVLIGPPVQQPSREIA